MEPERDLVAVRLHAGGLHPRLAPAHGAAVAADVVKLVRDAFMARRRVGPVRVASLGERTVDVELADQRFRRVLLRVRCDAGERYLLYDVGEGQPRATLAVPDTPGVWFAEAHAYDETCGLVRPYESALSTLAIYRDDLAYVDMTGMRAFDRVQDAWRHAYARWVQRFRSEPNTVAFDLHVAMPQRMRRITAIAALKSISGSDPSDQEVVLGMFRRLGKLQAMEQPCVRGGPRWWCALKTVPPCGPDVTLWPTPSRARPPPCFYNKGLEPG